MYGISAHADKNKNLQKSLLVLIFSLLLPKVAPRILNIVTIFIIRGTFYVLNIFNTYVKIEAGLKKPVVVYPSLDV